MDQLNSFHIKVNKEYLQQFEAELKVNFQKANEKFNTLVDNCIKALSTKSESEF